MEHIKLKDRHCANCRFAERRYEEGVNNEFFCHRLPPTPRGPKGGSYFPLVVGSDWCGEWIPADALLNCEPGQIIRVENKKEESKD